MTAATASIQMDLAFVGGEGEWTKLKSDYLELRRFFSKVRPLQWLWWRMVTSDGLKSDWERFSKIRARQSVRN